MICQVATSGSTLNNRIETVGAEKCSRNSATGEKPWNKFRSEKLNRRIHPLLALSSFQSTQNKRAPKHTNPISRQA